MTSLARYELAAKKEILMRPGRPLAWVAITLHSADPDFWVALAAYLSDDCAPVHDQGHPQIISTRGCYASALVEMTQKNPALLSHLAQAIMDSGLKIKLPKTGSVSLQSLLADSGKGGSTVWWELLKRFVSNRKKLHCLPTDIFIGNDCAQMKDYLGGAEWLDDLLNSRGVGRISDRSLYLVLAYEIALSLANLQSDLHWSEALYDLPVSMRYHSALGVLLILPSGGVLLESGVIKASHDMLMAPLGDPMKGIPAVYWNRPYHLYTPEMAAGIKSQYLDKVHPGDIVDMVVKKGSFRIAQNEKPFLSRLIERHPENFYSAILTPTELEHYLAMGVSAKTVAAHPCADPGSKAKWIKRDLEI